MRNKILNSDIIASQTCPDIEYSTTVTTNNNIPF